MTFRTGGRPVRLVKPGGCTRNPAAEPPGGGSRLGVVVPARADPFREGGDEGRRHFTLRKVAYGNCDRPYGSPCQHEHACVRCNMLRPEPSRLPLLRELEANLTDRIAEARERVWLGEVAGLQQTLVALRANTEHAERLAAAGITDTPVQLT